MCLNVNKYISQDDFTYNKRDTILSNELNLLLSQYVEGPMTGLSYQYLKLWIYNAIDSTYIVYANYNASSTKENIIVNSDMIQYKNVSKTNLIIYNTNFEYYIDETLVSKMTKNTHITDSIFNLKK